VQVVTRPLGQAVAPYKPSASFFANGVVGNKPTSSITLRTAYLFIKTGALKRRTLTLRSLAADSPAQRRLKNALPAVTVAATFCLRGQAHLRRRSGWLVLDFDKLKLAQVAKLLNALLADPMLGPSIVLAFTSPRGAGLKVWVAVDPRHEHKRCFAAVADHIGLHHPTWAKMLDKSGSDVTRLCLLCHDPNAYLNPNYETAPFFPMPVEEIAHLFDESYRPLLSSHTEGDTDNVEPWVSAAEQVSGFADENEMWYKIGIAFTTMGEVGRGFFHRVSRTSTKYKEGECNRLFDYWSKRSNKRTGIGTFIYYCKKAGITLIDAEQATINEAEVKLGTPIIPPEVYTKLPSFLQKCCNLFSAAHERDVMLLSTLGVLSGCLPGVGGTYAQREFGLNLFVFIIAPAASGKGNMLWAKRLAQPYHKRLLAESAAARTEYEAELAEYKANSKGKGPSTPPSGPPPRRMLYLPGNSTAAALLTALAENEERGIICETEADTLSGAMGADFGNFSDVLRSAFQHEPVTMLRKTDRVHVDLERPALSIILTGTPGQLPRLMPTAENGLVSRDLFYMFEQVPVWKDVSPKAGPSLDHYFDQLAEELTTMLEVIPIPTENASYPIMITLLAADWDRINAAGEMGLAEAWQEAGGAGASSAFRLGLIAWRIVGILTVLRCFEHGVAPSGELVADPADIDIALSIMHTARSHALAVLAKLPVPSKDTNKKDYEQRAAQRTEAIALRQQGQTLGKIANKLGLAKSTIQNWVS
jgi:hypothetical protein